MTDKEKVIESFKFVKELGFVKSNRIHNTGIGKTCEDLMNVPENNYASADLYGFEIKSMRENTSSYLTLFTKSPHPPRINRHLRDTYGEVYEDNPHYKKLHTSIFAHQRNTYIKRFGFRIINDKEQKKLFIEISDLKTNSVIERNVYYTYEVIEKSLKTKLKNLLFVNAETKIIDGSEYFHFNKAVIYYQLSLHKFLELLDAGKIMIDFRLGSYTSGPMRGRLHDHGTAFRIYPDCLTELYDIKEEID